MTLDECVSLRQAVFAFYLVFSGQVQSVFAVTFSRHGFASSVDSSSVAASSTLVKGRARPPKDSVIDDFNAFIAASPKAGASIVLMGDSTVTGLMDELVWNVAKDVHSVPVYAANDRPKSVMYGIGDEAWIKPGGEWVYEKAASTDDVTGKTVQRAQDATRILHQNNCSWSGGLETYVWRHEEMKGLVVHHWGFLPEYGDSCWKPCFAEAVKALQPSMVVWNIGYHLLNRNFKSETCARRANPAKKNCGDYPKMVEMWTKGLSAAVPTLVWRTTNWLCEAKQKRHQHELARWQNPRLRDGLEEECHRDCPAFSSKVCYDWFFSSRATELQYNQSLATIEKWQAPQHSAFVQGILDILRFPAVQNRVEVLDAYALSKECCERGCDETEDGEHYRGLDRKLLIQIASMAARPTPAL